MQYPLLANCTFFVEHVLYSSHPSTRRSGRVRGVPCIEREYLFQCFRLPHEGPEQRSRKNRGPEQSRKRTSTFSYFPPSSHATCDKIRKLILTPGEPPPREGRCVWDDGQQITSQPDIHSVQLTDADSFLVLACDGVWEVMSKTRKPPLSCTGG